MRQFVNPLTARQIEKAFLSCPRAELAVDEHDLVELRVKLWAGKQAHPYFCQNRGALFGQQESYTFQQVREDKDHDERVFNRRVIGRHWLPQNR